MLRLFVRTAPSASKAFIRNSFVPKPSYTLVRNMSNGKADNEQLKGSKLFDVSHVTALVTGGGTGIGLMITQALVANGAKVYITSRREEVLKKTEELYSSGPGKIVSLQGDVSSKEDVQRLYDEVSEKEPKGIQLLVNNAGIALDDATRFSKNPEPDWTNAQAISDHFYKLEPESWANTLKTNVGSIFWMSIKFLPLLAKGGEVTPGYTSSIINVSSISGQMKGTSGGQFAYATSKAAATHLSRMLATALTQTKVRVNVIAPGMFPSEMTTGESGEDNKSVIDKELSNPAGRAGKDTDMAATVLFLAGPGGIFYNEQILYPDGGSTLVQPSFK
ncbi:short chain dehydrogenase/reductase [Lophiotrema nucula]|uniref:Short chain dehydrogenase/reductase n=1 Tax=Lophiotrema nucula TaxID=690887 RepID=A0A6A5ZNI4_9PLEO|nr:short chain dehydrogenase/reductase [Lophiotrema nucula]